jgi:hypothetical protein
MYVLHAVTHQATVATRFVNGLHTITGMANSVLARRPFFVFWFMAQISRYVLRCNKLTMFGCNIPEHLGPWRYGRVITL